MPKPVPPSPRRVVKKLEQGELVAEFQIAEAPDTSEEEESDADAETSPLAGDGAPLWQWARPGAGEKAVPAGRAGDEDDQLLTNLPLFRLFSKEFRDEFVKRLRVYEDKPTGIAILDEDAQDNWKLPRGKLYEAEEVIASKSSYADEM